MEFYETDLDLNYPLRDLGGGGESSFGVHIKYDDIWFAMVYLAVIWVFGFIADKVLYMPALVGQIFAGIVCGPELLDIVPMPEAFVLLGEIGLVLLVIEAGVDIDVMTLKLIGKRGVTIAIIGSILPIAFGMAIAFILGADVKAAIAAGAAFGPTSLGVAVNILKTGKIINTPTGQLIIAAAIIDDMIALIILSQLTGLVGTITAASVVIPISSALGFLVIGGYIALFVLPDFVERFIYRDSMSANIRGKIALALMLAFVIGLMQATHYTKASHLMGAFIAGLAFCTDHDLHVSFVSQYKRVLQWLMRIFFASTIGFQVPITSFGNGEVLWKGFVFTLALLGKLLVGLLVPNFYQGKNFTGNHLRDCLVVGCSMAAEGEFAFVIAAYSVENGLIEKELYSSIVLAILLSTIIAPFSLRFTITYFNKKALTEVENCEVVVKAQGDIDDELKAGILKGSTVFFAVNTTSHAAWGTLPSLMKTLFDLNLDVIDHRSWHSRFESTVVNEVYVKGELDSGTDIGDFIQLIFDKVKNAINQEEAVISVSRWLPGCVEDFSDHVSGDIEKVSDKLVTAARQKLETSAHLAEKKDELRLSTNNLAALTEDQDLPTPLPRKRPPRRRVRIVSTPAGGAMDMFGEVPAKSTVFQPNAAMRTRSRRQRTLSTPLSGDMFGDTAAVMLAPGEVLLNIVDKDGKKYPIKVKEEVNKKIKDSTKPLTLVEMKRETEFTGQYLDGFIRSKGRERSLSNVSK